MSQGWIIDRVGDTITFNEAPANGAAIVVTETAGATYNATDVWAFGAWNPGFGYPAEVEFFSDRLIYANNYRQPQTLWMSQSGSYVDFGRHVPIEDTDAITQTINARAVNAIRELVPLSELIIMTSSMEWKLTTGADEVVAPGKTGFKPQTYWGNEGLPAQIVGDTAIFVQGCGNVVRDIGFTFTADKYTGNDLTIYANHLLEGFQVVDLAFQKAPYSTVWIVRSDGALISIAYIREQEVVGFALHHTDGAFESVCCVPDGDQDAVYFTVRRTVNNVERVSVEYLARRDLVDPRDAFFVDSGLTFNGRAISGTQTLSTGAGWTENDTLTLTGSVARWVGASDIGDMVRLIIPTTTIVNGDIVHGETSLRLVIIGYTDSTHVSVHSIGDVPAAFRSVAFSRWELLRDTVGGLDHLAHKTVSVLADGEVQGQKEVVQVGGVWQISLDQPAAVVQVGLPYQSLIESLDINLAGAETVRDRSKLITRTALLVKDTRGLKSGPTADQLDDFKIREFENYTDPIALLSGILDVNTSATWDRNGRFVVVQDDPLPATILSLIPEVAIAGTG
jgi:hypothetical protein